MSKKITIIIISVLVIIIIILFGTAYFISQKSGGGVSTTEALIDFLPFGGGSPKSTNNSIFDGINTTKNEKIITPKELDINLPKLRKISTSEISGSIILGNGASTTIKYTEKATGNIYETNISQGNLKRISNITIPKTQESFFVDNGKTIINRYLREDGSTIESFSMSIPKDEKSTQMPDSNFLPININQLIVSPERDKIFYIITSLNGAVGIISNSKGKKKKQILNSPFSEWLASWPNNSKIYLTTKASSRISGFIYSLNIKNSNFNKILGNITGLTTLVSPNGEKVLYSTSENKSLYLYLYNIKQKSVEKLSLDTLPEKCVWGLDSKNIYCGIPNNIPQEEYPDVWYQGSSSFSDNIWRINTDTGLTKILSTPQEVEEGGIDLINPMLSSDEKYLIFTNKKDNFLWLLDLNE